MCNYIKEFHIRTLSDIDKDSNETSDIPKASRLSITGINDQ